MDKGELLGSGPWELKREQSKLRVDKYGLGTSPVNLNMSNLNFSSFNFLYIRVVTNM